MIYNVLDFSSLFDIIVYLLVCKFLAKKFSFQYVIITFTKSYLSEPSRWPYLEKEIEKILGKDNILKTNKKTFKINNLYRAPDPITWILFVLKSPNSHICA